jgi:hypothetical protein
LFIDVPPGTHKDDIKRGGLLVDAIDDPVRADPMGPIPGKI